MPRRGENIYKRKDGRWEARYVKEILPDGRRKYGSVYAKSYAEVKAKQQAVSNNLNQQKSVAPQCFQTIYEQWLFSIKSNVKQSTYLKYARAWRNHLQAPLGALELRDISAFRLRRLTDNLRSAGLSPKTINDILIILNNILRFAAERYQTELPRATYLKCPKKEMRVLTFEEQQRLTRYLENETDIYKFGVLFALMTGVRVGELCALEWRDISENAVHITKTMQRLGEKGKGTQVVITPPKTACSQRVIPLPKRLLPYIERFRGEGYVLAHEMHEYTEPRLMQMKFKKMMQACQLEDVGFHTLRHTFATRCVEAGVDVKTLSELLGHSDIKTTLNRYVHSSFSQKCSSMDKLEQLLIS